MRSALRQLPERVKISVRLFRGSAVKIGLPLDRSQPIFMVTDPGDELILLHPRHHIGRPHRKGTSGASVLHVKRSTLDAMGGSVCRLISVTTVTRFRPPEEIVPARPWRRPRPG